MKKFNNCANKLVATIPIKDISKTLLVDLSLLKRIKKIIPLKKLIRKNKKKWNNTVVNLVYIF